MKKINQKIIKKKKKTNETELIEVNDDEKSV